MLCDCKLVKYCDEECQKKDKDRHKKECKIGKRNQKLKERINYKNGLTKRSLKTYENGGKVGL